MALSVDQLIAKLEQMKQQGLISGDTPVGVPSIDNNGKAGVVGLAVTPVPIAVAKDEFAKGWTLCRKVSRGGAPVLVIEVD